MSTTTPRIYDGQQTPSSVNLLKAQAYAYSQAKRARNRRLIALAAIAGVTTAAVIAFDADTISVVSVIGLISGIVVDALARNRASGRVQLAVAVQEKFDTTVFQLPWNSLATRQEPSPHEVARLAAKYKGDRFSEPWYPDTAATHRPLDILICQQSNLAWGAPTHRKWAWALASATVIAVIIPVILWLTGVLTGIQLINAIALPWFPLLVEAYTEVAAHFNSASDKEEAHQQLLTLWRTALTGVLVDQEECRQVQDEIAHIRLRNASTPDWFDQRHRKENEQAMRAATDSLVIEAVAHGKG